MQDFEFKELEQRLQRYCASQTELSVGPLMMRDAMLEAADAIRQQAERIAELERADDITMTGFNKAIDERNELQSQLSAAQQRLERWEGQPVVGEIVRAGVHCEFMQKVLKIPFGTKLIARLPDNKSCHRSDAEGGNDEQITRP